MQPRGLKSLAELSQKVRGKNPPADLSALVQSALHLSTGKLEACREGDDLVLTTSDKTVRLALRGMESQVLAYLARKGHEGMRRMRWSAA